jgi:hypothetical protein
MSAYDYHPSFDIVATNRYVHLTIPSVFISIPNHINSEVDGKYQNDQFVVTLSKSGSNEYLIVVMRPMELSYC